MRRCRAWKSTVVAACLGIATVSGCTSVEGGFVGGGEHFGDDWEMTPESCRSLEPEGFFGVVLRGPGEDDVVRLYREAPGQDRVQVVVPGSCDGNQCLALALGLESDCDVFETELRRTSVSTNDVRHIDGRIALDCRFEDDGWIMGEVSFSDCN
jgi:hypothetical protein